MSENRSGDAGKKAYGRRDYLSAINDLLPLAQAGEGWAQAALGHIYCLSLHRFQMTRAANSWSNLRDADLEACDIEDGVEAAKWLWECDVEDYRWGKVERRVYSCLYANDILKGLDRVFLKAVVDRNLAAAGILLGRGAEVNARMGNGFTALLWIAQRALRPDQELIELLVNHGADVNAKQISGISALEYLASHGNDEAVKLLLDSGAEVNDQEGVGSEALVAAAGGGHLSTVKLLVDQGALVNGRAEYKGNSALIAAAWGGYLRIVTLLLTNGADPMATNDNGMTPLDLATKQEHAAVVKLLKRITSKKPLA